MFRNPQFVVVNLALRITARRSVAPTISSGSRVRVHHCRLPIQTSGLRPHHRVSNEARRFILSNGTRLGELRSVKVINATATMLWASETDQDGIPSVVRYRGIW